MIFALIPLLQSFPVRAGWPAAPGRDTATKPATTAPSSTLPTGASLPRVDYYAMTAEAFFKQDVVRARFKQTATASELDRALLEAAIFHATNQARVEQKMEPLAYGPALTDMARQHSDEMVLLQYIAHESPVPAFATLADRFTRAGLKPQWGSENIAMMPTLDAPAEFNKITKPDGSTRLVDPATGREIAPYTYEKFAHVCVKNWMDSPHHRANILSPKVKMMAVGLAVGMYEKQDSVLVTQNFSSNDK